MIYVIGKNGFVAKRINKYFKNKEKKLKFIGSNEIDLTKEKAKDRLTVEFIKHERRNQFFCRLPDYYNQQCILAVCVDSNDAKDIALKSALFYNNAEELQKAQNEILPLGGKRLVGGKIATYLKQHREIYSLAGVPLPSEATSSSAE